MSQSELGQFTLDGGSKVFFPKAAGEGSSASEGSGAGPYAAGRSPVALQPDNHTTNVKLAAEPALRVLVTLQPQSSCGEAVHLKSNVATSRTGADGQPEREPKVTTADALEALHRDTGLPIISDFYTRLYRPEAAAMKNRPLFDVLDDLGDTMRLRWHRDSSWLQFRSTTFYDDRRKEVPNRLLFRWASSRRQQAGTREVGGLTLDELVEIAQLPNAELDGDDMAEGAQECWGLREWDLARSSVLRPHLRFLASFTPAQRQEAMSPAGLPFTRMTLAQQKQFIEHATLYDPLACHELPSATMRVEYTQPGWFQWANPALAPHWMYYLVAVEPGRTGHSVPRPRVRERTREAAIEALHRLDPRIRERALYALHLGRQPDQSEPPVPLEAQVFPSELTLTFVYIPGASNAQAVHIIHRQGDNWQIPGS